MSTSDYKKELEDQHLEMMIRIALRQKEEDVAIAIGVTITIMSAMAAAILNPPDITRRIV